MHTRLTAGKGLGRWACAQFVRYYQPQIVAYEMHVTGVRKPLEVHQLAGAETTTRYRTLDVQGWRTFDILTRKPRRTMSPWPEPATHLSTKS